VFSDLEHTMELLKFCLRGKIPVSYTQSAQKCPGLRRGRPPGTRGLLPPALRDGAKKPPAAIWLRAGVLLHGLPDMRLIRQPHPGVLRI